MDHYWKYISQNMSVMTYQTFRSVKVVEFASIIVQSGRGWFCRVIGGYLSRCEVHCDVLIVSETF